MNDRIAIPNRLQSGCIERDHRMNTWRVWLHTNDFIHGTFLCLYADGKVTRVTIREGEGDDEHLIRHADKEIT